MYKVLSIPQKFEQGSLQGYVKQDLPSKEMFWKISKHCYNSIRIYTFDCIY